MKTFIVSALALVSTSALACPNLSGRFTCHDFENNSEQDIVISQSTANGVTSYKMVMTAGGKTLEISYVADGQVKNIVRDEFTSRTEKSFCAGTELKKEIHAVRKDNGEVIQAVETIGINAEGHMYDTYVGRQGDKPINFSEVCQRR